MVLSAADYRRESKATLQGKWGIAMGAYLVAALLGGASLGVSFNFPTSISEEDMTTIAKSEVIPAEFRPIIFGVLGVFAVIAISVSVALFFVGSIVGVGYSQFNIDIIDGKEASFGKLFSWFKSKLWSTAVLCNLLSTLYTFLWTLLFIIPGIMAAYSYIMAPYILAENPEMGPKEAIARSKEIMAGHRWDLFCLHISYVGWNLLSLLTLGILSLWIQPWMNAATAMFYRNLVPLPTTDEEQENPYTTLI